MRTTPTLPARLAAVLLGLLVVLTGVGLTAGPASASAPTAPRAILAAGYDDFIRVYWAPPALDGGKDVTSYRIERILNGQIEPQKVWTRSTSAPLVDTTVQPGIVYKYRVRATNADGTSAWSTNMLSHLQPNVTEHHEFGTDVDELVVRQYQDFLGRNPTGGELQAAVLKIEDGTMTTGQLIDGLVHRPERAAIVHPVTRLYFAYFDRAPDRPGLEFWVARIQSGTHTLHDVSNSFAAGTEFKETYGLLTNAEFVTLVYQNVLDRAPDAVGLKYWKGKLDGHHLTRGQVMTSFSESGEFKGTSRGRVLASDVYGSMIGVAPVGSELLLWAAHIQGGGNAGDYGTRTMLLFAYP